MGLSIKGNWASIYAPIYATTHCGFGNAIVLYMVPCTPAGCSAPNSTRMRRGIVREKFSTYSFKDNFRCCGLILATKLEIQHNGYFCISNLLQSDEPFLIYTAYTSNICTYTTLVVADILSCSVGVHYFPTAAMILWAVVGKLWFQSSTFAFTA